MNNAIYNHIINDSEQISKRLHLQEVAEIQRLKEQQQNKIVIDSSEIIAFNVDAQAMLESLHNSITLGEFNKDPNNFINYCPHAGDIPQFNFAPATYALIAGDSVKDIYSSEIYNNLNTIMPGTTTTRGEAYTKCMKLYIHDNLYHNISNDWKKYTDSTVIESFCANINLSKIPQCEHHFHFPQLCTENIFKLNCYALNPLKYPEYEFSYSWFAVTDQEL